VLRNGARTVAHVNLMGGVGKTEKWIFKSYLVPGF
jgi:hypothetical protein